MMNAVSGAHDRSSRLAAAIGEPHVGAARGLEARAKAVVDGLLGRLMRVSRTLVEGEPREAIEQVACRLLLSDLAMVTGVLRTLNGSASERLTQATAELAQARAALERADLA
jgi:hypothetical protein